MERETETKEQKRPRLCFDIKTILIDGFCVIRQEVNAINVVCLWEDDRPCERIHSFDIWSMTTTVRLWLERKVAYCANCMHRGLDGNKACATETRE